MTTADKTADKTIDILNLQFTGADKEIQQIVFTIDIEEFGVDVLKVQEIIRYVKPVKVPQAPVFIQGVINFRGEIIPVIDLRRMFGLDAISISDFTVIIVVESNDKIFGIIVDRVTDIVSLSEANIQNTPEFSSKEKTRYLKAMGKLGERLILMLDLDRVVDFREIEATLASPLVSNLKSNLTQNKSGEK